MQFDGAFKESLRRSEVSVTPKQKVDRGTGTVDGSLQVLPLAGDFDVRPVHPPVHAHRALSRTKHRGQDWPDLDRPAMNRGVIDEYAALGHRLFKMAQAQRVPRTSACRPASPPTGSAAARSLGAVPGSSQSSSRRNRPSRSVQTYCDRIDATT